MAKRGRKAQRTYVTMWQEAFPGLRQVIKEGNDKNPQVWHLYPTGKSSPYFGTVRKDDIASERRAIAKFMAWKSKQEGSDWETKVGSDMKADAIWQGMLATSDQNEQDEKARRLVVKWTRRQKKYLRNLLLQNPRQAATEFDIEQLAYFDQLKPPPPSLTLKAVGELYANRRKTISTDWKRRTQVLWDEFCLCVGVRTVRKITADCIARYYDTVYDAYTKGSKSSVYVHHRFGAVKAVFNHALTRGNDQEQLQRVLGLCKMLVPPPKPSVDPQPIAPEIFRVLLDQTEAKPLWKAVLLLSLNAALYPSEVAAVDKSDIDMEAATLVMDRGKTGVPRVAVLWPRTVEAIRDYQHGREHKSEALFVSRTGRRYDADRVARNIRKFRRAAHLPETVTFNQIRDGALTAAFQADGVEEKHAKVLAGHRCGISDHYVKRNPGIVATACTAIEKHYFGDAKTTGVKSRKDSSKNR